jgi:hypothetical protein
MKQYNPKTSNQLIADTDATLLLCPDSYPAKTNAVIIILPSLP